MKAGSASNEAYALGPVLGFLSEWWALNHAIEKASKRMHTRIGVTAPQRMLVRVIGSLPGITPGQLARVVHLDPGTVSTAIGRLEQARLVERRRAGRDGRNVSLALTPRGRALNVRDTHTIEGALERAVARASRRQMVEVRGFIERFVGEIGRELEQERQRREQPDKPRGERGERGEKARTRRASGRARASSRSRSGSASLSDS